MKDEKCDGANTAENRSSAPTTAREPASQVERNYRWREKNGEHWRKYQRDLMRKRRAEGKA